MAEICACPITFLLGWYNSYITVNAHLVFWIWLRNIILRCCIIATQSVDHHNSSVAQLLRCFVSGFCTYTLLLFLVDLRYRHAILYIATYNYLAHSFNIRSIRSSYKLQHKRMLELTATQAAVALRDKFVLTALSNFVLLPKAKGFIRSERFYVIVF